VHGLPDARRALAAGLPLGLLSAPGAASYAGCGWWLELTRQARAQFPGLAAADWLDCGDAPGRATAALRIGCRGLILAPSPAFAAVAAIAEGVGARLLTERPESLDMADGGAERRLADWLTG
jgi:hypothetical protein